VTPSLVRPRSRAAWAVLAPLASRASNRPSTGVTFAGSAAGASRSPSIRNITSRDGVSPTASLTGSAVSSPYRSAPPGARHRTDTW
jgi:hypothetical protein